MLKTWIVDTITGRQYYGIILWYLVQVLYSNVHNSSLFYANNEIIAMIEIYTETALLLWQCPSTPPHS